MDKSIQSFISKEQLCSSQDRILIAISGGVDSVVLLFLLFQLGYDIGLAHCNFSLRNSESDADEKFVESLAKKYHLPFYSKKFDTLGYAKNNKLSIEMAARELRYNWFNNLLSDENYDLLATGHHVNDSIETIFLNLCRGTGINGLTGIKAKNNNIIRPLLFATRERIESYAKDNQLNYRYDASNDSMKYMRNIVRHQVIPAMRKINSSFDSVMERNLLHITQSANVYNDEIKRLRKRLVLIKGEVIQVDISLLLKEIHKEIILFEILSPYGFNQSTISNIFNNLSSAIGSVYFSAGYQLLIDRSKLIIEKLDETVVPKDVIENIVELKSYFTETQVLNIIDFKLIKDASTACFDLDLIHFPLHVEMWNDGDSFYPLGMNNKKKISDFLIDTKVSRFDKKRVRLLKSKGQILWVIQHRIDDRFKVTDKTKKVLVIKS